MSTTVRSFSKINLGLGTRSTLLCILFAANLASSAQTSPNGLAHVTHSTTLTFFLRNGTCASGTIAKADATTVVVNRASEKPLVLRRGDLLQVIQDGALLFSARSSWADVTNAPVNSQEAFVLKMKSGRRVQGRPIKVTADSITLKHGFTRKIYDKSSIATVTYLRVKPETDGLDYLNQEAPYLMFFDPEFYSRAMRLEGRMPVLLYDSSMPEDDAAVQCPHDGSGKEK